ncbi:MAG: NAD-dependent deacylase [bacterium]
MLRKRSYAIALTGAGISVDSGIPDFRSPGGLWTKYDPMEYATIGAFRAHPEKVWQMLFEVDELVRTAEPNPGHRALAELEQLGRLRGVVTQNIDGLHQRAGSERVVEFHGGSHRLVCEACDTRISAAELRTHQGESRAGQIPRCDQCERPLRPDIVFFGEPIPRRAMSDAFQMAGACDAVLVIGTSATVSPASEVPVLAKQHGAVLLEFNLERTPLSHLADVCVLGSASETLPALVTALRDTSRSRGTSPR